MDARTIGALGHENDLVTNRQWAEWRLNRRRLIRMGAFAGGAAAIGLPWCREMGSVAAQEAPRSGGSVRVPFYDSDVQTLDPISIGDAASAWTASLIYDQVLRISQDGQSLEPALAERWEVSEDGLLYTFHLRETGFHDGTPCTADDVVYSLNRVATDPASFFGFLYSAVASFEAADPATVTARLKVPWAPFLADLAFFGASILPKAAHEARQESLFEAPIGTGPFVYASRERGVDVVLRKNPNYWDVGKPYLDEVHFLTVLDADERLRLLRAGEADIAFDVPYAALPDLHADPGLVVVEDRLAREDFAIINTSRPPFDDKALRQAMNYAVDKEAIIRDVIGGAAEAMTTYLPKMPGHDDAALGYPFDLERAITLAAASAGKDGFDAEVLLVTGDPVYAAVADRFVADLANIGGRITVTAVAKDTWGDRVTSGDFDLAIAAWTTDILDPQETTGILVVGTGPQPSNSGFYDDPQIDALAQQASVTNDPAERTAIYAQIQAIHADAAPYIFLYYPSNRAATTKSIRDFHIMPTAMLRLWETWRDDV